MKLQLKSSLLLFVIGIIFLLTVSTIYYYLSRDLAIENAQISSLQIAKEYSLRVKEHLEKDAHITSTLANSPVIEQTLTLSNSAFKHLNEEERKQKISRLNKKWMETKDVNHPFIQSYMTNPIATYLKKQQELFPNFYGEIFLTNRYGAIIATTKKLTTLAHAHKYWWIDSYYKGKGKIFFDDRGYDKSVKGYVLGVVVPVKKGDKIIGILKANIKILGPYSHLLDEYAKKKQGTISLVRSKGLVVFEKDVEPLSKKVFGLLIEEMKKQSSGALITTIDGTKKIISYAPVSIERISDRYSFGGKHSSADHIKGGQGEEWFVILSRDVEEAIATSENLTQKILLIGLVFMLIIAVSALLMGRRVSRPILKLIEMTRNVGKGDFKSEIKISSKDELGDLAKSFNNMLTMLRKTTTSRDKLLKEISQRKLAEEDKHKLEVQLHHAQKMEAIGQLTGGIAHDFNNMLASIMGYTDLTREGLAHYHNEQLEGYLNEVYKASERARDLVAQMLAFSRDSEEELEPLILLPLIKESLKMLGSTLPSSIEIELQLDDDSLAIMTNRVQLHQLIMNLCINARDAMQGKGHITISLRRVNNVKTKCCSCYENVRGDYIQLSLRDDGVGMTTEQLDCIFDPFYTTKELGSAKGTGMGLAMVHGIMHSHGGHIIVETEAEKGTTFTLLFPVIEIQSNAVNRTGSDTKTLRKQILDANILIVDDEAAVGGFIGELLKSCGCQVTVETDSQSALLKFRENPEAFDLLVTDQTMPGMTGAELAQSLMVIRPELPVILCTGYSDNIDEDKARLLGIRGYLNKPINNSEFLELVRNLLAAEKDRQ